MPQTSSRPGTYKGADLPVNWGFSASVNVVSLRSPSHAPSSPPAPPPLYHDKASILSLRPLFLHAFSRFHSTSLPPPLLSTNRQLTGAGAPPPKRTFNDLLLRPTRRISLALTGRAAAARWAASRLIQDRTAMPNHLLVKRTITDLLVVLQIDTTTCQASSRANVLLPAKLHLVQSSVQPSPRPTARSPTSISSYRI
jgi:hypothetical protein